MIRCFICLSFACWLCAATAVLAGPPAHGPAIHLCYQSQEGASNTVGDFMYFVPLISMEPVYTLSSPGGGQSVQFISVARNFSRHSFTITCEVEVTGDGWQQSIFDLRPSIRRREHESQKNDSARHLKSIDVHGPGAVIVEVEGAVSNGAPVVGEVRMRFNAHGHASPVSIDLCELRRIDGTYQPDNELLARVNTLTFRRQPGPPTMEVTVASVKRKDAGDSLWQKLKGRVAGAAVNMMIDPLTVEAAGHEAMLNFGRALAAGEPSFTFPFARNLQTNHAP